MYPEIQIRQGIKLSFGFCCACSVVRAFERVDYSEFPSSGLWLECPVCRTYTMHFRIQQGKVGHATVENDASDQMTDAGVTGSRKSASAMREAFERVVGVFRNMGLVRNERHFDTFTTWQRPPAGSRGDIVGVRYLSDGRTEYLCHNESLCSPYYLAVSGPPPEKG